METVQGYVILKAATFETGHGFALGHNPGAPSPFVTWQFTEGEKNQRDYYWGRYGNSQAWAQKDFDRRVDDYQQLYHAAVKHTELGEKRKELLAQKAAEEATLLPNLLMKYMEIRGGISWRQYKDM